MIKRMLISVALAGLLIQSIPAEATCVPGRIGIDPKTGRITLELPRCEPPPQ